MMNTQKVKVVTQSEEVSKAIMKLEKSNNNQVDEIKSVVDSYIKQLQKYKFDLIEDVEERNNEVRTELRDKSRQISEQRLEIEADIELLLSTHMEKDENCYQESGFADLVKKIEWNIKKRDQMIRRVLPDGIKLDSPELSVVRNEDWNPKMHIWVEGWKNDDMRPLLYTDLTTGNYCISEDKAVHLSGHLRASSPSVTFWFKIIWLYLTNY